MAEIPFIAAVDDDEAIREAIQSLIRSVGLGAEVFASAEDFLQSDHLRDTACLIVDVRMPRMNGLELQWQLAAANCPIPLIFILVTAPLHVSPQSLHPASYFHVHH